MISYIVISCGVFVFALVCLCLSSYGANFDRVHKRVDNILSNTQTDILDDEELSKPLSERLIRPIIKNLSFRLQKYLPKKSAQKKEPANQQSNNLKKMVRQSGLSISASEYSLIRLFVVTGLAVFFGIISAILGLGSKSILGALFGAYCGYAGMRFHLTSRISKRRKAIEEQLPDVLDLLSVNVEAGLGFEQALLQVIGHFEGPLIDELNITYREMTMGRTRRDALTFFAERCEISEIKTFSSAIVQAEQLGISIKNVLRTQAAAMRTNRRNKVEEKAMKISVKILLPMVGFIFPVLLIVLMGPAAVKVINQFKGG